MKFLIIFIQTIQFFTEIIEIIVITLDGSNGQSAIHFPYVQFYKQTVYNRRKKIYFDIFWGESIYEENHGNIPINVSISQNGLENPSIENWPIGKKESNFFSVTTKTSMSLLIIFYLIIYLQCQCSNCQKSVYWNSCFLNP